VAGTGSVTKRRRSTTRGARRATARPDIARIAGHRRPRRSGRPRPQVFCAWGPAHSDDRGVRRAICAIRQEPLSIPGPVGPLRERRAPDPSVQHEGGDGH
jgi:hypothetical protein